MDSCPLTRGWRGTSEERFLRKVTIGESCWEWTGSKDIKGYGQFRHEGKTQRAHRVAYLLWVGDIPDGLTIDHLCRNTSCVNTAHMELVTPLENFNRGTKGSAGGRVNALKTHCKRGHPYDEANTYRYGPSRYCKACHNERRRK